MVMALGPYWQMFGGISFDILVVEPLPGPDLSWQMRFIKIEHPIRDTFEN